MTVVRSRLIAPDNTPRPRVLVTVQIYAQAPWTSDKTSCVAGTTTTYTTDDGWWQLDIVAYERMEGDPAYSYVKVIEHVSGEPMTSWLRVPESEVPLLMRDLLVEDPTTPPPWRPWPTLGMLGNVDPAVDAAPAGKALVRTGDRWTPADMATTLAALGDVDTASLAAARVGDPVVLLDSRKWGCKILLADIVLDDQDPTQMTVLVTCGRAIPDRPVVVDWGAGGPLTPIVAGQTVANTYVDPDAYMVVCRYVDGSDVVRKLIIVGDTT